MRSRIRESVANPRIRREPENLSRIRESVANPRINCGSSRMCADPPKTGANPIDNLLECVANPRKSIRELSRMRRE
eukprot:3178908-Prymnesium_polylepis.1